MNAAVLFMIFKKGKFLNINSSFIFWMGKIMQRRSDIAVMKFVICLFRSENVDIQLW